MTWGDPPIPFPGPGALTAVAVGENAAAAAEADAQANDGQGKTANELWGSEDPRSHEYWCSDYVIALWQQAGADVTGLTCASGTFAEYLGHHLSATPHVGDAVVFNYVGGHTADHVAIVTHIDGDMITTVSGDWNGHGGTQDAFAQTSRVVENQPYSDQLNVPVPQMPGEGGPMEISGFMSPIPLLSPDNGVYAGLGQLPVAVAGASFHAIAGQVTTGNDSIGVGPGQSPLAGHGDLLEGGRVHDRNADGVFMGTSSA